MLLVRSLLWVSNRLIITASRVAGRQIVCVGIASPLRGGQPISANKRKSEPLSASERNSEPISAQASGRAWGVLIYDRASLVCPKWWEDEIRRERVTDFLWGGVLVCLSICLPACFVKSSGRVWCGMEKSPPLLIPAWIEELWFDEIGDL